MMEHRLFWILFGAVIGFVSGYVVRYFQEHRNLTIEIRDEVIKIDENIKKRVNGEDGFAGNSWLTNLCLFLVVVLTAYSAFASQQATNSSKDQQHKNDRTVSCTSKFLAKTISALNARTQYSQVQADANLKLQQAQAVFLTGLLHQQPGTNGRDAVTTYLVALGNYTNAAGKNSAQIALNPYPTQTEYQNCLQSKD